MAESPKRPKRGTTSRKKPAAQKSAVRKPKAKTKPKVASRASGKAGPANRPPSNTNGTTQRPRKALWRRVVRWVALSMLVLVAFSVAWVLLYRYVNPPVTALMLARHYGADATMTREWRDMESISPDLALAVIASEDQRFPDHHGFDTVELRKVIEQGLQGGPLRGASTISQQVAKNAFLWPARSWLRKGLEVYFTALVEVLWSKERILEVYLNIAEFGEGVYGAEAAARACFGRSADALSAQEAATLAAVLPNPRRYNAAKPSARVLRKRDWILQQMTNLGGRTYLDRLTNAPTP